MEVSQSFKARLLAARQQRGWTQAQAAEAAGVTLRAWESWEQGTRTPNVDVLPRLAEALGVSRGYLAGDPDQPTAGDVARALGTEDGLQAVLDGIARAVR